MSEVSTQIFHLDFDWYGRQPATKVQGTYLPSKINKFIMIKNSGILRDQDNQSIKIID